MLMILARLRCIRDCNADAKMTHHGNGQRRAARTGPCRPALIEVGQKVGADRRQAGRSIQLGLTSGAQTPTVFGRNEPAMIHCHQQMQAALGRPVPDPMRQAAE
jgi:hypothetical protein